MTRPGRDGGFTLLEVIVAFAILAVALVAILQAFSSGLRGLGAAEASATAVRHVRAKMEEVGETIPLEPGQHAGEFADGYRWTAVIVPYEAEEDLALDTLSLRPYEVVVSVTWEGGRPVTLRTLRLASGEEARSNAQ